MNAVLFSDGTVSGSAAYDPYGQERGSSGDTVPFGYAGGHHDSHTGLVKFGARYYNPAIGAFTQMDPAGQEQNPYLYAAADPINNTDPTGLSCGREIFSAFVGGAVGGAIIGAAVQGWTAIPGAVGGAAGRSLIAGANCYAGKLHDLIFD